MSGVGSLPGSIASLRSPVWCGVVVCLPLPRRLGGGLALLSPARRTWTSSSLWDVRRCVSSLACVRWSPRRRVVLHQVSVARELSMLGVRQSDSSSFL